MSPPRFVFKPAPPEKQLSIFRVFLDAAKAPEGTTARDFARKHRLPIEKVFDLSRLAAKYHGMQSRWKPRPEGGQESVYYFPTQERGAPCSESF